MPNLGGILDVTIGMSFIYLLLSLVCSGANELVAWLAKLRAATLRQGIATLLKDPALERLDEQLYRHPLIKSLSSAGRPSYIPSTNFVLGLLDTLVDHQHDSDAMIDAIAELMGDKVTPAANKRLEALLEKLPSAPGEPAAVDALPRVVAGVRAVLQELPDAREIVAQVADGATRDTLLALLEPRPKIDTVAGLKAVLAGLPERSRVRRQLELFLDDGVKDTEEYRRRVQAWFDHSMDRVSGLYKRQAQGISVAIGVSLAVLAGVDSGVVADALMHDGALRQATVAVAIDAAKKGPPPPPKETPDHTQEPDEQRAAEQMVSALDHLDHLELPIGLPYLVDHASTAKHGKAVYVLMRVLGILFTGLALALGAPFWFDMLNRLINLRTTGPAPEKSKATTTTP